MKHAIWLLTLLALVATWPAAAGGAHDGVEERARKCLATPQGQTTAGMAECSHQAYVAYDKQMNELYQRVLQSVDPKSRELIREAQRRWLAYRQAQQAADQGPWSADRGSMVVPDIEALHIDALRTRMEELRYYAP
jgi:uncharacterized protein YecT (DUF1311 family)